MKPELGIEGWSRGRMLAAISIFCLLAHLPFLAMIPMVKDEGPYSMMIEEQISHPSTVVTFFGYEVGWKPPLMFWTYGAAVQFLRGLPIPLEAVYRLPGTAFGLANALLVFLLFEALLKDRKEAFFVTLVYLTTFLPIHVDSRVLTDSMMGTAVLAGVLAYVRSAEDRRWYAAGGLAILFSYFIKQTLAAIIPVLALAFFFGKDRRRLQDPLLYASFIGLPLAMWLFEMSIAPMLGSETVGTAVSLSVLENYILPNLRWQSAVASLLTFFPLSCVWFPVSMYGFAKNWRRSPMLSAWYIMSVFPLFAGTMMAFYFYPVIPAMSYFALQLVQRDAAGRVRRDAFFMMAFLMMGAVTLGMGAINHASFNDIYQGQKEAGEFLAGKENVLIIGEYSSEVFSYKALWENRASGGWLDFGLIIFNESEDSPALYRSFMSDYYHQPGNVVDGNFARFFADRENIFRKDTNITRFDYVCITGGHDFNPGGELVFERNYSKVYHVGGSRAPSGGGEG